jgi:tRNA threonylcarbamoyladenosine biosynthesis protein TsaB
MLILAIDTSTRTGSVAVLRDELVLAESADASGQRYSVSLCSAVDSLLQGLDLSLSRIDLFAVCAGPGSFTGLRVGLAAVKAWAETLQKPISSVSGLEAIAEQGSARSLDRADGIFVPVLDARRGQVFGAVYERRGDSPRQLQLSGEEVVSDADELLAMVREQAVGRRPVFATATPELIRPALARSAFSDCAIEEVSPALAPIIGLLGYRQGLRGQTVDALSLEANYVRRSDAEMKWKGE